MRFLILVFLGLLVSCDWFTTKSNSQQAINQARLDFIDTLSADYQLPDSVVIIKDSLVDERDSNVYQIVTIGEQTWFAENLVYVEKPTFGAYYYDNDSTNIHLGGHYPWIIAMNRGRDGGGSSPAPTNNRIITQAQSDEPSEVDFEEIQGICPEGWHVPTVAEWETLFTTVSDIFDLGANEENDWQGVGKILKDTSYYHTEEKYRGVNLVGFNVIEAGLRSFDSWGLLNTSEFWTSDTYADGAWAAWLGGDPDHYFTDINGVVNLVLRESRHIPVRCLKNN